MEQHSIDVLALQETHVNSNSTETHGDFHFYFSSDVSNQKREEAAKIREQQAWNKGRGRGKGKGKNQRKSGIELYNLDAKKLGVGIVIHRRLKPFQGDVKQVSNRNVALTLEGTGINCNIISTYAPHSEHSEFIKDMFYKELGDTLDDFPTHHINIILGDFNEKLITRLPSETSVIGPHIFGSPQDKLDVLS